MKQKVHCAKLRSEKICPKLDRTSTLIQGKSFNFYKYVLAEVKIPEVKNKSEHDDEKKTKKFKLWPFG